MKTHYKTLTCLAAFAAVTFSANHPAWAAEPDADMKVVLDKLTSLGGKPVEALDAKEAREQPNIADAALAVMKDRDIKPEKVFNIDETPNIELSDTKLDARVYHPLDGDGPFPVILYIHGGGWVLADLKTYDSSARALANASGAVVVSTHYRQAPEHKFPAAHNDTFGAYQWLIKNASRVKGDPNRIAVVGESAGGNMAAAISLQAKDQGLPLPVHQVLVYPVANLTRMDSPSYVENANAKPLNKAMMDWFGKQTLNNPAEASDPRLSLALAGEKLKGSPPTTIILAEIDPLRSDGEELAKALEAQGVKVSLKNYSGVTHEFFGLGGLVQKAKDAEAYAGAQLKAAFGTK